jgi:putative PIN family toxin of toxin-antitoxin system
VIPTVVLDTNVYISAVLFGGKPEEIIKRSREGELNLVISEAILKEIAEILRRKFNWQNWQISETLDEIRGLAILVVPRKVISVIKEDAADNLILECALEGKADYIVSGDEHHLLPLKEYQGVKILSSAAFLGSVLPHDKS